MNAGDHWARVSSILSRALDRPEAERTAFVAQAIRDEPALRTEVLALFAEMREMHGFLEKPIASLDAGAEGKDATFGPYRVVGKLGEGGMGVVHLAERSDGQFTRRVAIKRVGSAAPPPDVLRRFGEERQILARLDHPNVARLLDAGLDAAGIPYLVMDHVEGEPLMAHCRERALSVRQRLTLFVKICAAVQHAHQNLVIHRDLKPANILVTAEGEPKLLDFGIARVFGGGDATETTNRALTLDYASPEQVRGDPVTTASDVYSLGVVLHEMLTDRKPYEATGKGLSEAVHLVCDRVPPPASAVAPAERQAEIAGDLDSVVRRAMEKAPAERYASVAELAADVAAHLDHLPVRARRPSFGYVAWKFVCRHRTGAAVAAAVSVLLAGGVVAVAWEARVAERERARAQHRFDDVRQLASYMIFDLQDGISKLAGSTELRKKMVERSLTYLDSLAGEATGDSRLQRELAEAYRRLGDVQGMKSVANLGDTEGARRSFGKARDLLEKVVARNPGDADARRSLGRLLFSLGDTYTGEQPDLSARLHADSLAIWQQLMREEPQNEANLRGLASAHFSASLDGAIRDQQSLAHMEQALDLFGQLLAKKPDDLDRKRNVALCHRYLAGHYANKGDSALAYPHCQEAARLDSERLAAAPKDLQARTDYHFDLSTLGDLHATDREYAEALQQFEPALAFRRELWRTDPANTYVRGRLAYMLTRVAEMHVLLGHSSNAAPLLSEALEHGQALPKQDAWDRMMLAKTYLLLGEVSVASKKDPCRWYRSMEEWLAKVPEPDRSETLEEDTRRLRDRALERLKACPASRQDRVGTG